jgi:hypothetical protein
MEVGVVVRGSGLALVRIATEVEVDGGERR